MRVPGDDPRQGRAEFAARGEEAPDAAARPWPAQTILVTGAARRLGRALAEALAARGAGVALHYHRSQAEAEALAEALRPRAREVWLFRADLSRPEGQERLAEEVLAACPRLTGLVNSASLYEQTRLTGLDRAAWDAHLAVNLTAPVWLSATLGCAMQAAGGGAIVQVGDASTLRPYRGYLAYTVSKGGLEAATRALARELAPQVRVNMVALGPILLPEGSGPDLEERVRRAVPLGRVGLPREFAAAVLHLLSDATYSTGSIVQVDGGRGLA